MHGAGSVVGLAPSATAAAVLGGDLGIATENTAEWLTNHRLRGETFTKGQLVIVDEASLAGTFTLRQLATLAAEAGAKLQLVGDHAQLQAVDAGGAFAMLVASRQEDGGQAPQLADVHRFRHDWEKQPERLSATVGVVPAVSEAPDIADCTAVFADSAARRAFGGTQPGSAIAARSTTAAAFASLSRSKVPTWWE